MQYLFSIFYLILSLVLLFLIILILREQNGLLRKLSISCLIVIGGILNASSYNYFLEDNSIKYFPDTRRNSTIMIEGIVTGFPDIDTARSRFILDCLKIYAAEDTFEVSGYAMTVVRKNVNQRSSESVVAVEGGDLVRITGRLQIPSEARNPGEFDYKKYLKLQGIHKTFSAFGHDNISILSKKNGGMLNEAVIYPARKFALDNISRYLKGDEAAFMKGLVAGDRTDISDEVRDNFINAGVMHLIAVSGLNVAYIIISVTLILSLFRIPLLPRTLITILFLVFYCLFTGSSPSIIRASIMGILVLLSALIERKINFYNIIGVSALIILMYDSRQLYDAGFILSYSAVLSMAVFMNIFDEEIMNKIRTYNMKEKKLTLWLMMLFFTSLSAQIGTLPVTAMYFGKISVISVIANIVAVPLANLTLAVGFFQIIAAAFSEYASQLISNTSSVLLSIQLFIIKYFSGLEFSFLYVRELTAADMICFYALSFIIIFYQRKKEYKMMLLLSVSMICIWLMLNFDAGKELKISFIDVGQGDCALIQTPDDKIILVDCGRISFTHDSGERTIAPYLRRKGISKIDIVILTHLHLDHVGGLLYLAGNFKIGMIVESGQSVQTRFISSMDSILSVKSIPRKIIRSGDVINEIKDLRFYFLFPSGEFVTDQGKTYENNLNNGSVAFILKYGETEIFFGGDIEKEGEEFLADAYGDFLKTDILKASHHGSMTSSSVNFLLKNKPDHSVISCGLYNKFNHPSDSVLKRLTKAGSVIHRTDLEGAVLFQTDGSSIEEIDWR